MATPTPPAGIIFQADFDIYTNDWIDIVTNNKETELANCFRQKSGAAQNINYVSFSALQIAQLVSTVGAQNIKARFLVVREAPDKKYPNGYPHFALALFATDNLNGRLSAYYISNQYWPTKEASEPENTNNDPSSAPSLVQEGFTPSQLPDALATYWQQNWSPAGDDPIATQDMFDNAYGYLHGYTFELNDFVQPLTSLPVPVKTPILPVLETHYIRINFGLHQYYPATPNVQELNSTFGLMVSYVRPPKHDAAGPKGTEYRAAFEVLNASGNHDTSQNPVDDTNVFYDLAHPCPPTC
jgi:hypothetical protein